MNRVSFWSLLILITLATSACSVARTQYTVTPMQSDDKINGLCWVGSDSIIVDNFQVVHEVGAEWISLTAFGAMHAYNSPLITPQKDQYWWGDSDNGLMKSARVAHEAGTKVMLKPHLTLPRDQGYWRHDIEMDSKDDWQRWFNSYEQWIVRYAMMAADANIEMLCIGTELYMTTTMYPKQWSKIIKSIRAVYPGKLVYAANWYQEVEGITFWDELDYIGVQGYYPLGKKEAPSKEHLLKKWKKNKQLLSSISKTYKKPVLFTEMGYKNTMDAAVRPWEWPQDVGHVSQRSDMTQQVCYEAFFETFWSESWIAGGFIWNWHHPTYKITDIDDYFRDRTRRMSLWSSQIGKPIDPEIYFSPQQRPAYNVVRTWFSGGKKSKA